MGVSNFLESYIFNQTFGWKTNRNSIYYATKLNSTRKRKFQGNLIGNQTSPKKSYRKSTI